MIILDTNVISEGLRPNPDPAAISWLDDQLVETLYLTTITVAELRYGIARLPAGRRRDLLGARVEADIVTPFRDRLLGFDREAADAYGDMRAGAARRGESLQGYDALIAAIALANGSTVATRDVQPFEVAGVAVIDPFG